MTIWTPPIRQFGQVNAATLNPYWRDNINYIAENLPHKVSMWHNTSLVTVGNAIAAITLPGQYFYRTWRQNASADADSFTHSFECATGLYTFSILCRKTTDGGLIDWELDGVSIDTGMDFYDAGGPTVNQIETIVGVGIGTPGRHVLTGTVNGQTGGSGGYDIEITKISAVRTGAYYVGKVLSYSPLGFWRVNEAAGPTAADSSGNSYDGTGFGITWAADTGPDASPAPTLDGLNDYIDFHSAPSEAAFSAATGTGIVWVKIDAGAWADSTERHAFYIAVNASNRIRIYKSATANKLTWVYQAGGTAETVNKSAVSDTGWICLGLTWDTGADAVIAYYNGVKTGATQTGLGVWAGTPGTMEIGARGGTSYFDGSEALAILWDSVKSPAEMLDLATV